MRGLKPLSPSPVEPRYDLAFVTADGSVAVVEVKSATAANLELQLRLGLGQVLWYAHRLQQLFDVVHPVLALELDPPAGWSDLLTVHGVDLLCESSLALDIETALARMTAGRDATETLEVRP